MISNTDEGQRIQYINSIVDRAATLDLSLQIRLGAILKHHGAVLCNANPHTLVNLTVAPIGAIQAAHEFLSQLPTQ